jgi:hypothetical protein
MNFQGQACVSSSLVIYDDTLFTMCNKLSSHQKQHKCNKEGCPADFPYRAGVLLLAALFSGYVV